MERPLTSDALEDAIAYHCAAVLLDARPASMFTFVGDFASSRGTAQAQGPCMSWGRSNGCADAAPLTDGQRSRRRRLTQLLDACEKNLSHAGIRARILSWRPCGAIVFVYRPDRLARSMADPRVSRALALGGYRASQAGRAAGDAAWLDALLEQLGARFSCETGVPHEIGFFLGFPYEDVAGFIAHRGRNFICFGCWKVYANPRQALRSFSRFKRCARRAARLRSAGATLADLARPATPRPAGARR